MIEAGWWGFVGGAALLLGAVLGLYVRTSLRVVGLVMGFGVGVLVSAVSFELANEAYEAAGGAAVVTGLAAGSLTFFAGDWLLDRRGGHRRKSPEGPQDEASPTGLVLGALLDGIPESAAIGVSLLAGGSVSTPVVVAVFLSNVPESMSASVGMRRAGHSTAYVLGLWGAVTVASTLAAMAGYGLLGQAGPGSVAVVQAFAAGAILTMLVDTMVPEAVQYARQWVGLVTVLGFATAFLLSMA